jgi:glycerol-1-phosphate dehydrogenase [NAD(P)+]
LVADPTTWNILGSRITAALRTFVALDTVALPDRPHADMATVEQVRARAAGAEGLIAVGSGTINDLVKYAAYLDRKPYACFATAPSMNGYVSVNAAIMENGVKKSLPAAAPRGVFMDLEVLARAPKRMIGAGFGDSICRPTAQADWLLAHLLLDRPYREIPFTLLVEDEAELLADPEGLLNGDAEAMARLARLLVMSGFGMTICGGSYPASQGEHLIAHFLEMRGDSAARSFHGEQIAVTTLTMARIQAAMLAQAQPRVGSSTPTEAAMAAFYGRETGAVCWEAFSRKAIDRDLAASMNDRLDSDWPGFREALLKVHRRPADIETALKRAGAPTRCEEIGVPKPLYRDAVLHAREIRDRFTFLDFAAETGGIPVETLE